MNAIKRNLRIFCRLSTQNIRMMLEYKGDFLLTFFSGLLMQTMGLVFLFALFQNIPSVGGWSFNEVALLFACGYVSEGFLTFLFQGTTGLAYYIRQGQFDRFMLRPVSVTTQVLSSKTNLAGLGTAATGVAVMIYAFGGLPRAPGVGALLLFALNLTFGVVIRVNVNYATTASAFWLRAASGMSNLVYNTQEFAKYPITIYPTWLQAILLTILPHAVISYIPVCLLLGRLPLFPFCLLPPVSAVFMVALRRFVLRRALIRYESAGN